MFDRVNVVQLGEGTGGYCLADRELPPVGGEGFAVRYGALVIAAGCFREALVALRAHVRVPDFRGGALRGDDAGCAFGVVNVLFGLFLALLYGLTFAGCDGTNAFGSVASLPDKDACSPVGAVRVDGPRLALLGDFGGGDVA